MRFKKEKLIRLKRFLGIFMSIMLLVQFVIPNQMVEASDVSKLGFIRSVKIADKDGNPLGDNIPNDTGINVVCEFTIPNYVTVKENDTYTVIKIPQEINLNGTEFKLDLIN